MADISAGTRNILAAADRVPRASDLKRNALALETMQTRNALARDQNTRLNAQEQRQQSIFDNDENLRKAQQIYAGVLAAEQNPAAIPAFTQSLKDMGELDPSFTGKIGPDELNIIRNGLETTLGPRLQTYSDEAGRLLQENPVTGEIRQVAGMALNTRTGALQELDAINADRQAQGLPPISAEQYLTQRRQTSGDMQSYNQYLSTLPEGSQPLSLADYKASTAGQVSGSQTRAKTQEERFAEQIDAGFAAADALPVINRGIELLDQGVKTGGWEAVKLWAQNRLGITGADEGELSANLGKAVLSQLRSTFGAAFTENEGQRLAEIEAGFGKSAAVNLRLLQQAQQITNRAVRRGIIAANRSEDPDTAKMLEEAAAFQLSYGDDQPQQQEGPPKITTAEEHAALPSGAEYIDPNGEIRRKK